MQLKSAVAMAVAQALAAAPIRFLAWELPYATGAALKKEKKKKIKPVIIYKVVQIFFLIFFQAFYSFALCF